MDRRKLYYFGLFVKNIPGGTPDKITNIQVYKNTKYSVNKPRPIQ